MKTEQDATAAANQLLKKLNNPTGWYVHVWENMGWHYRVQCGAIAVSENFDGTYYALLSHDVNSPGCGAGVWTTYFNSKDINEVISHELRSAMEFIEQCIKAINSVNI